MNDSDSLHKNYITNGKRYSTPQPDSVTNPSDFLICGGTSYVPEDGITGGLAFQMTHNIKVLLLFRCSVDGGRGRSHLQ